MVTTDLPATSDMGATQERTALPSTWTVQLPHSAAPQPNLVPVRPSSSRKYHRSGIDGSPSYVRSWPLTFKVATGFPPRACDPAVVLHACSCVSPHRTSDGARSPLCQIWRMTVVADGIGAKGLVRAVRTAQV